MNHRTPVRAGCCPQCWNIGRAIPLQDGACPFCTITALPVARNLGCVCGGRIHVDARDVLWCERCLQDARKVAADFLEAKR